jgi:hypothetical protein
LELEEIDGEKPIVAAKPIFDEWNKYAAFSSDYERKNRHDVDRQIGSLEGECE